MAAPSSVAEILEKNPSAFEAFEKAREKDPNLSEHLIVHKPWIDHVTWTEPGEDGVYRRVPEVIDGWFDSGSMPFAQWGFPHQGREEFERSFPADYITEAIDQTRGWFYSLLMISTLVFDKETTKRLKLEVTDYPHPYRSCIVLGHVTDPTGKKESKSKGNYTPPDVILDRVAMEFAVVSQGPVQARDGTALVAREDFEGLDLRPGSVVKAYAAGNEAEAREFPIEAVKGLPRRVVLLSPADCEKLGVTPTKAVSPSEVPRLSRNHRLVLEDAKTPRTGRGRFPLVFPRCQSIVEPHPALAQQCAIASEGVPAEAQERLFLLHDLRRHRRVRSADEGASHRGTGSLGSLDPFGVDPPHRGSHRPHG